MAILEQSFTQNQDKAITTLETIISDGRNGDVFQKKKPRKRKKRTFQKNGKKRKKTRDPFSLLIPIIFFHFSLFVRFFFQNLSFMIILFSLFCQTGSNFSTKKWKQYICRNLAIWNLNFKIRSGIWSSHYTPSFTYRDRIGFQQKLSFQKVESKRFQIAQKSSKSDTIWSGKRPTESCAYF